MIASRSDNGRTTRAALYRGSALLLETGLGHAACLKLSLRGGERVPATLISTLINTPSWLTAGGDVRHRLVRMAGMSSYIPFLLRSMDSELWRVAYDAVGVDLDLLLDNPPYAFSAVSSRSPSLSMLTPAAVEKRGEKLFAIGAAALRGRVSGHVHGLARRPVGILDKCWLLIDGETGN